jgi:hypothetical protein
MGLISTIPAPATIPPRTSGTASQSVAAVAHAVAPSGLDALPVWPVTPPASSEAIVRDHWTDPEFIRPLEAEGLELDGIPFIGDEAILLDDVPQDDPDLARVQDHGEAMPPARQHEADTPPPPDHRLNEVAARAYEDARAIAGLAPIQQAQPTPEAEPAQSPENRAPA